MHYTNKLLHVFGQYSKIFGMFQCLEFRIFRLPGQSPGRAIVLPSASAAGSALAKSLMLKFFYVMGKALSGELSCPCDRSC